MHATIPLPRFEPLQRVVVCGDLAPEECGILAARGTVIWRSSLFLDRSRGRGSGWLYVVRLARGRYVEVGESRLVGGDRFDAAERHLGRRCELSFDPGQPIGTPVVRGTYRLPGQFWAVFRATEFGADARGHFVTLPATGSARAIATLHVRMARGDLRSVESVKARLADALDVSEWCLVAGPRSLALC